MIEDLALEIINSPLEIMDLPSSTPITYTNSAPQRDKALSRTKTHEWVQVVKGRMKTKDYY